MTEYNTRGLGADALIVNTGIIANGQPIVTGDVFKISAGGKIFQCLLLDVMPDKDNKE